MILRTAALGALLTPLTRVSAQVVPEITTLAEGFNYIIKLPCVDCPFLYQDTSEGENGPWVDRVDDNALLLNISLAYDATHLSINNAPFLTPSNPSPRIHATQILQDYPSSALDNAVSASTLDTTGPLLGLSYGTSLHSIVNSTALVFRFNIFSLHFALTSPPIIIPLEARTQQVIELVFLPRPLQSPADTGAGWEIISAALREREKKGSKRRMHIVMFDEWDEYGRKGSPGHLVSSSSRGVVKYAASGFWGASMVVLGALVLFVGGVVTCVMGWERYGGEYERAQGSKGDDGRRSGSKGSGSWTDVEKAKGRFLKPGQLTVSGSGTVTGVGKSD
ncbi:hypothetical protein SVAN01_01154 [Stagonosporopsis vannaccii]|nr:hypothetical protein SVAN01_01154 [Stagonosporopsis vannaccii]